MEGRVARVGCVGCIGDGEGHIGHSGHGIGGRVQGDPFQKEGFKNLAEH